MGVNGDELGTGKLVQGLGGVICDRYALQPRNVIGIKQTINHSSLLSQIQSVLDLRDKDIVQ